jgi:hypothetical protein
MVTRRILLWAVLVFVNAIVGLYFSLSGADAISDVAAISCGVLTFMLVYIEIDYRLGIWGYATLRRRLVTGAILRALLQLYPVVDMGVGIVSVGLVNSTIGDLIFLSMYLSVLTHAFLLSLIVAAIMALIQGVVLLIAGWKNRQARLHSA